MSELKKTATTELDEHVSSPYPKKVANTLDETVVFNFAEGVPAFEDSKRFVLVVNEKIKPFFYLKSLDVPGLGFVCIDPFMICANYSIKIPAKDQSLLGLADPSSAFVLSFVTVEKDPHETTANLLAPVIINTENMEGRQVILDENWPVRFNIWHGLEEQEKEQK